MMFIETARLDHVVIFGTRHLQRVLAAYSAYYNKTRMLKELRRWWN